MLQIEHWEMKTAYTNWVADRASLEPLVLTPPLPQCEVCVIVPVRDEAENLLHTLSALSHQIDQLGQPLNAELYEIILLANNCSDDSAAIAQRFAKANPTRAPLHVVEITLPPSEAHVGRARRILMDEAYRRLTMLGRPYGVIASTDGDSKVAPTWVAATLEEIRKGADAVGGRILTEPAGRVALDPNVLSYHLREVGYLYLVSELEAYLDPDPYDRWPRHYQHFGASLAVTAQMYKRVGGIPAVRTPEDVALYRALLRVDARFRHSLAVRVVTSTRQVGRTKNGLANQLSEWATMARKYQPYLVESVSAIETRLRARRRLRMLWRRSQISHQLPNGDIAQSADELGVASSWLAEQLQQPQTFGLLLERTTAKQEVEKWAGWPRVEIASALHELRIRLDHLRHQQGST